MVGERGTRMANVCEVSNMLNRECPCPRHWRSRDDAFIANSLYRYGDRRRGGYDVDNDDYDSDNNKP